MPKRVATGLKKVSLTKKKINQLNELRARWEYSTIDDMMSLAYEDWQTVTGSIDGFAHYQVTILDTANLLNTETGRGSQKMLDAMLIQEFFKNAPEDSTLKFFANELEESILKGSLVATYGS